MFLIIGLGNPGEKYCNTRHNVGFIFLDYLAEKHGLTFSKSKWKAVVCKGRLWGEEVVLVKPETFMNLSGMAVGLIASYYRINPADIVVVYDDLDLPVGRVKMACNRGPGGHNGIISLISHLNSKAFNRVRIGIGRPKTVEHPVSNFVLGKFENAEFLDIERQFPDIEHALTLFVCNGSAVAMNYLNTLKS